MPCSDSYLRCINYVLKNLLQGDNRIVLDLSFINLIVVC